MPTSNTAPNAIDKKRTKQSDEKQVPPTSNSSTMEHMSPTRVPQPRLSPDTPWVDTSKRQC